MPLELIPVIEIGYNNQGVPIPDQVPYWVYPQVWDTYHQESYIKAGFKDPMKPYLAGSSFYKLTDISDSNLTKLVIDHTQGYRDGDYEREMANAFFGGYVLRIDGQDVFYPQCCGDLADIHFWENLAKGQEKTFYAGHPEPYISIDGDQIMLNLTTSDNEESFEPPPIENYIQFDIPSLKRALEAVKPELDIFQKRLVKINQEQNLNIEDIGGLLIWDNVNYE